MPQIDQPAPKKTLPRQTQELRSIHRVLIQAWHPTHSHLHPPPDPHPASLDRMDHPRKLTRGKVLNPGRSTAADCKAWIARLMRSAGSLMVSAASRMVPVSRRSAHLL